ncbi:MAG: hypothetical protein ACR2H1_13970 [Limisphaerales bacterium]
MKNTKLMKQTAVILTLGVGLVIPTFAAEEKTEDKSEGKEQTIKGEVVDLMCYLDHGAKGDGHKECATKCIKGGGPVGILGENDQLYLIVGDHKPMNDKLAAHAAEMVTVKGKVVERNGMKLIENAELEK